MNRALVWKCPNVDIGAVTAIAAPATLRLTLHGEGGHAGAVLMPGRHDALIPSAKVVQAVQKIALECPSEFAVATTGRLEVFPGAVNSIPSRVMMEIDIRDVYQRTRDGMVEKIARAVKTISESEEMVYEVEIINADMPVTCDEELVKTIESACSNLELKCEQLISHAYHDSLFMAQVCPTAMLFIPSEKGYSHRPEEYSSPDQIEKGVKVLALTLAVLAGAVD